MARSSDILYMTEYIKNVLYFATVRQGKVLKSTTDTHYFSIDNELVYENYYSDFGPLNLGCIYMYCKILNEKLKQYLHKQTIIHYTSIDPKKKANAAFLLGCYGVLYLSLSPRDALKPLTIHGQSYRPFQDAVPGESTFTISLINCLQAIQKAHDLGFFNFQDFNYEEYKILDKIQGGDLNWIVPGKFLAFIGPVDYSMSLYHPPDIYIDYFLENNVKIVIRLNKRLYDGNVFNNAGITHYDLFFPDGSCPPRHILFKFLQISEETDSAIGVHCKAGLGRTGSLIGCYLIKHYRMTAHEAIGWMRICRPGSVIGHQQEWLEKLEPWLTKQGNIYRKRMYQDTERLPTHEFGIYSIAEKARKQRPVIFNKSKSPPPPMQRQTRSELTSPLRPQASRIREAPSKTIEETDCRMRLLKLSNQTNTSKGNASDTSATRLRRGSGAGEPRAFRSPSRSSTVKSYTQKTNPTSNEPTSKNIDSVYLLHSSRISGSPDMKVMNNAGKSLKRNGVHGQEQNRSNRSLDSSLTITPHYSIRVGAHMDGSTTSGNVTRITPSSFSTASRVSTEPYQRRRLGRSPSPPQLRVMNEQTRATNTPSHTEKNLTKETSKSTLKEVCRIKLPLPRDGSVGAASLGARREAPAPPRAPSVRSDERPLATQGDMLNSIKFQRRYRDSLYSDKLKFTYQNNASINSKEISGIGNVNARISTGTRPGVSIHQDFSGFQREKNISSTSRGLFNAARPTSPKGKRQPHYNFY